MQVHFRHPDRIKENWNARYIELLSWYSDVERTGEKPVGLLAKVEVEGSNPFARSSFLPENQLFEPREAREGLVTTVNSPGIVTTLSPVQFQLGTIQACSRPSQPNQ